jgi:hypothetical protein
MSGNCCVLFYVMFRLFEVDSLFGLFVTSLVIANTLPYLHSLIRYIRNDNRICSRDDYSDKV